MSVLWQALFVLWFAWLRGLFWAVATEAVMWEDAMPGESPPIRSAAGSGQLGDRLFELLSTMAGVFLGVPTPI